MSEQPIVTVKSECPNCGSHLEFDVTVPTVFSSSTDGPALRSKIKPTGSILVYKINSEEMKQFIIQKAKKLVPDSKVEVVPRYCEKKRRKDTDPHRSYASLRIAFSDDVIEQNKDLGWYGKIGEGGSNVRIVKSLFDEMIQRYQYNRKDIDKWLKSYKNLEELEEALGMTEAFINDIKEYSIPQRVKAGTESWVIFSAAAENVIYDMMSERGTDRIPGKIRIQDVYPISKDVVEWTIYMYPNEMDLKENPHVRQILMGEEKAKK